MAEGSSTKKNSLSYKAAGVDIDAGAELVEQIKPLARQTRRPGSHTALGGFGALFDLKAAGYRDPVLVASTDGVGTKLLVATEMQHYETIGVDLVAMSVNDVVVQGAAPLFFLDYFATSRLDVTVARQVIAGIALACRESDCALIGGETAEMPGLYRPGDFDLAGFVVGAAERDDVLTGDKVGAGDVILGLASSGIHSNGYSLVRKVVEVSGLRYRDPAPFDPSASLGEVLLRATRLYVRSCLALHRTGMARAFAHITGGGLIENIPRVLPAGLGALLDADQWPLPPVFRWLESAGGIPRHDLVRTFNCGIGMMAVVGAKDVAAATEVLAQHGQTVYPIGHVVPCGAQQPRSVIAHLETAWRA
ncbi:MAG: phosphoribosylformylglycinamidine cyclo-ligase [Alphaproteobacteria bacterium]|nr:phosphoribosylformylglycinamidine cyclo-ligase [Alphaproteobacteria bacterium]